MDGGKVLAEIRITYKGQIPSKSNKSWSRGKYRKQAANQWKRIVVAQNDIGFMALSAWKEAGYEYNMLRWSEGKKCVVKTMCWNQRLDFSNAPKLVLDALEGICYWNDRTVASWADGGKDDAGARVEIVVEWKEIP